MVRDGRIKVTRAAALAAVLAVTGLLTLRAGSPQARDGAAEARGETLLIDDFSSDGQKSPLGTKWTLLADRVTGGASTGTMQVAAGENRTYLRLSGSVRLKDNSGFIQARLNLHPRGRDFNAWAYDGIRLVVKGNGESYAVYLRTKDTRLAAQRYETEFRTDRQWQEIELPFGRFLPAFVSKPLDRTALRSVAVVATNKEFNADILIDKIAFYRTKDMYRKLTPQEEQVIVHKGTEAPFSGKYNDHFEKGVYTCKQCGAELFESSSKFEAHCGWPSFDEQIPGRVKWQPDSDGQRTEIVCHTCGAHLGHVFPGEGYTETNTRYCVNSISMDFIPVEQREAKAEPRTERALFASGCFWGTQYHFQRAPGVISTTVGYTGGHTQNPTYKQVCTGRTGHAETTEVIYDPTKTSYEQLAKLFFETHDFTQLNRQGPDMGTQYRSAVFYLSDEQKQIAERLVQTLRHKGHDVKTEIRRSGTFWPAENYHQDYYNKTQQTPYCHVYRPIFDG